MTKPSKPKGDGFVRMPHSVIDSEAFIDLSANAGKLLLLICRRYNGFNNRSIRVSLADAERFLSCGRSTARRTFRELEGAGFIELIERGGFRYRNGERIGFPSAWRVTFLADGGADVVNIR